MHPLTNLSDPFPHVQDSQIQHSFEMAWINTGIEFRLQAVVQFRPFGFDLGIDGGQFLSTQL